MANAFTKLASDAWGVCSDGPVAPGADLLVNKKDGTTAKVTIDEILRRDPTTGVSTCSIVQITGRSSDTPRTRECAECG